jgi:hypothetical protein
MNNTTQEGINLLYSQSISGWTGEEIPSFIGPEHLQHHPTAIGMPFTEGFVNAAR